MGEGGRRLNEGSWEGGEGGRRATRARCAGPPRPAGTERVRRSRFGRGGGKDFNGGASTAAQVKSRLCKSESALEHSNNLRGWPVVQLSIATDLLSARALQLTASPKLEFRRRRATRPDAPSHIARARARPTRQVRRAFRPRRQRTSASDSSCWASESRQRLTRRRLTCAASGYSGYSLINASRLRVWASTTSLA